ncbi:MAG TPA: lytic transglycosylase domain-containing protein [Edaphobacter sp.]|nr:lytic transglycosylase domain-containing protein [Edaphobacter sp.]
MATSSKAFRGMVAAFVAACAVCPLYAAQRVMLRNGFELNCARTETIGNKVRLYTGTASTNYLEVDASAILQVETVPDPPQATATAKIPPASNEPAAPTKAELREMLAHAGIAHHIDTDLLVSVMKAESGGNVRAVSRAGARGLMQLMPQTASAMGVQDTFRPEQNIAGGTAYLDELLNRYGDNIALALAAYNAGPAAVDRYHGIPPYRETRAYVARVIREFNRRKQMTLTAQAR